MHYYKFNVASWAKDTGHLSPSEEGIYLRLINHYYDTEKPIPLKTNLVFRKLRLANDSELAESILDEFFTKTKDGWIHNHCEKLISEYQKMAERNKKNAKLGGRPKNKGLDKPAGFQDGCEDKPTGIPNQEPRTNNQEPETNNDKPSKNNGRFAPPSVEEIHEYMVQRNFDSLPEAEKFYDFYESKGWMVGKNKMKSWQAAIRNWLKGKTAPKAKPATASNDFSFPSEEDMLRNHWNEY